MEPMAAVESVRYVRVVLLTLVVREAQEPGLKIFIPSLRWTGARKKAAINSLYFSLYLLLDYLELGAHRNISFGFKSQSNEKLMIFGTMHLALRALCLMTQEHETGHGFLCD